jgi:hypothetical protein
MKQSCALHKHVREALDHGHPLGDNLVLCTSMRAFKILLNLNKLSLL